MKLSMSVTDLGEFMRAEVSAGQKAVSAAVSAASKQLQTDWRAQVTSAGLGTRLSRTIRTQTYPKGQASLNAAALVWTRAPTIIDAHEQGAVIYSKDGFWLAIPTEAAGRLRGGKRPSPGEWEQRTGMRLIFVYRPGRPSLLIAEARLSKHGRAVRSRSKTGRGLTSVPIFILVPQVRLRKRLNLDAPVQRVLAALPGDIAARWGKT